MQIYFALLLITLNVPQVGNPCPMQYSCFAILNTANSLTHSILQSHLQNKHDIHQNKSSQFLKNNHNYLCTQ